MRKCSIFVTLLLAGVCGTRLMAQNVATLSPATDTKTFAGGSVAHPLQIAAGDLLEVDVFDTTELSGKFRVDDQGRISLPVAGDLNVFGMTAQQAGHAIEKQLLDKDILKDPHVSVSVLEYSTQGVTVLGEVKNPGVYPLLGAHSVLDLISAAGGVTPSAGKAVTVTHRDDTSHPEIVNVDSKPGSTAAFGVDVRPGDTIMVSHAGIVYVLGDVGKPGGFLIDNNERLSVLQAVALAQGTNRTASLDRTKLIRKTANGREETPVPLKKLLASKVPDQILSDGDILYIPVSGPKNALRDVENALPSVAGAAIYHVP